MVLKLSKNVQFLQFFDDLSRKSDAIEEIYKYNLKVLLRTDVVYDSLFLRY